MQEVPEHLRDRALADRQAREDPSSRRQAETQDETRPATRGESRRQIDSQGGRRCQPFRSDASARDEVERHAVRDPRRGRRRRGRSRRGGVVPEPPADRNAAHEERPCQGPEGPEGRRQGEGRGQEGGRHVEAREERPEHAEAAARRSEDGDRAGVQGGPCRRCPAAQEFADGSDRAGARPASLPAAGKIPPRRGPHSRRQEPGQVVFRDV